ncbi:hypothetical protein ACFQ1M_07215 [Sungkyunkwania multivorans]|uniref:Lipoprotein n=1 Tax=Sungkyunkwania multivorans TaxID=1173618 RepID=A0ABW3CZ80_9FLAO
MSYFFKRPLILLPILVFTMFASCSNDDNDQDTNLQADNVFEYVDTTVELNTLIIDFFRTSNRVWIGKGVNMSVTGNNVLADSTVDYVYFDIQNQTDIEAGTYQFNLDDATAFTFFGEVVLGYDPMTEQATTTAQITGGTLTVEINEGEYTFVWDCTVSGGIRVQGNYTGTVDQAID